MLSWTIITRAREEQEQITSFASYASPETPPQMCARVHFPVARSFRAMMSAQANAAVEVPEIEGIGPRSALALCNKWLIVRQ
jgi:hypothetical protein